MSESRTHGVDTEWMHTLGFGPLDDEEHPYGTETNGDGRATQQAAHRDKDAHAGPSAGETAGADSFACPGCGQLALVAEHGRCACQEVEDE